LSLLQWFTIAVATVTLEPDRSDAYDAVVEVLGTLAPRYQRTGRATAFDDLVTDIRADYRRRPIARLDRAGL
jgi:hypothetical protein